MTILEVDLNVRFSVFDPGFQFQLGEDSFVFAVQVALSGLEFFAAGGHDNDAVLQLQLLGAGGTLLAHRGLELAAVSIQADQFAAGENGDIGMAGHL